MNVQNIPRDDKAVKAAFKPKLDCLVYFDYPNIELKLLAYYLEKLGHPSMADAFRAGEDLHIRTAANLFSIPYDSVTDSQRQVAKRLNFSIVYGGGTPTLMEQLDITYHVALELLTKYHAAWPGIGWESKRKDAAPGTLIHYIKKLIKKRGYVLTLWGRHLHPRSMHSALNAVCQGCAADLMKWALIEVDDWCRKYQRQSHLINCVHDELQMDVAEHELGLVVLKVPQLMTYKEIQDCVPIRPEPDVSWTTWADKEPYESSIEPAFSRTG